MSALNELSAVELLARYRDRSLSPVEVTRAVLDRIAACEPQIHATYALDAEQALSVAHASQARWAAGAPMGALDGVPVTLKENIATQGVPMPMGSAATTLVPALVDAPAAARLREAGAVIVTKTTMPDFGMLPAAASTFHPLTRNPWDLSRNTGGSSSGAGAAAAAGYGPLHLGTDIGGSVRIPSNFCGVFGLKPSLGRIPIDPPFLGRCAGPMTRTVTDSALLMATVSLPDARDHMSLPYQAIDWMMLDRDMKGVRIGLMMGNDEFGPKVDPEVKAAVLAAAKAFEGAGAIVEPMKSWVKPGMFDGFGRFLMTRLRVDVGRMAPERRQLVQPAVMAAGNLTADYTADDVYTGYAQVLELRAATVAATTVYDFVLSPVTPTPAFAAEATGSDQSAGKTMNDVFFTVPFNVSEQPACSVNCGYTAGGLPIGLQIAGRRFDDLGVLQMARAYEQMRPSQHAWPEPTGR
ncbi:MAG: Amidase [Rhizobacter sp.]|nr:Amidase [Rhizobacter sp.]